MNLEKELRNAGIKSAIMSFVLTSLFLLCVFLIFGNKLKSCEYNQPKQLNNTKMELVVHDLKFIIERYLIRLYKKEEQKYHMEVMEELLSKCTTQEEKIVYLVHGIKILVNKEK